MKIIKTMEILETQTFNIISVYDGVFPKLDNKQRYILLSVSIQEQVKLATCSKKYTKNSQDGRKHWDTCTQKALIITCCILSFVSSDALASQFISDGTSTGEVGSKENLKQKTSVQCVLNYHGKTVKMVLLKL